MKNKIKGVITVRRNDVQKIIDEIKNAPEWKIKKWAKEAREERKRVYKSLGIKPTK